jgi:hypothetical protein
VQAHTFDHVGIERAEHLSRVNRIVHGNAVYQHEILVGRASTHVNGRGRFGRKLDLRRSAQDPKHIRLTEQRRFHQGIVSRRPRPGLGKGTSTSDQVSSGEDSHIFQFNRRRCERYIELKGLFSDYYASHQRREFQSREPQGMTSECQTSEGILPERVSARAQRKVDHLDKRSIQRMAIETGFDGAANDRLRQRDRGGER